MASDKMQITFLYSSNSELGKKALGYVQAAKKDVLAIDISKTKIGDSEWADIDNRLGKSIGDLIDMRKVSVDNASDLDDNDWLKMLQQNDEILQKPIIINGDKAKQLSLETEVLEFLGVDSAGLNKTMHTDQPDTKSSTNGETMI